MGALLRLTATETRLFFREPLSWGFSILLPPLLLTIFGLIPSFRAPEPGASGLRVIDLYPQIVIALAITMLALATLPQQFATYRDKGVLRRMRVTPVRPSMLLGAQLLMCLMMALATMLIVLTTARLAFTVALPQNPLGYLIAFLLVTVTMLTVGLLVASLAPTGPSVSAVGTVLMGPLLFFAGLFMPRSSMNPILRTISDFSPLGAGVQSLQDSVVGGWPQPLHIAVMLAWICLCGGAATRFFRWE